MIGHKKWLYAEDVVRYSDPYWAVNLAQLIDFDEEHHRALFTGGPPGETVNYHLCPY